MTKEEHALLKQRLREEKERAYKEEPEVKNWIEKKRMVFRFFAVYWIVHAVLSSAALHQLGAGFNFLTDVLAPLFQIFWLYVFISPNGTWRINLVLYFWALYNLMLNLNNYLHNLQGYLLEAIRQTPVLGAVFGMEVLVPFLFLATACYFTLPKPHRDLSERAGQLQKELAERFKAMSGG